LIPIGPLIQVKSVPKALDIYRPKMDRAQDETTQVRLGRLTGRCNKCGAEEFSRAMRDEGPFSDVLVCAKCGANTTRAALLDQIANEAIGRANRVLDDARAWHRRHKAR
jgi:hypothetical protein